MRVVLQGELGSFHHLAARHWYTGDVEYVPTDSFSELFAVLADGRADQGVVAIENSLFGSVNEVYDLLANHGYPVIGELSERVHQHLITLPGASLKEITEVISHPVALAQCTNFLQKHMPQAERVEYYDTAGAVSYIKRLGNPRLAAIGSSLAAEINDLKVVKQSIENDSKNYTRFLVVAPDGKKPANANKASLVLQTSHQAGALHKALGCFADAGINLTKLQSRPIIGKVWKYQFYIDIETSGNALQTALAELKKQGCMVKVLGEYMAAVTEYQD